MSQQLSLWARPRSLDGLVGQTQTVRSIRGLMATGRVVKAWLFTGPRGCGKTSISRILALSYQCTHQEKFGVPCLDCRQSYSAFPIYEINAGKLSGKADINEALVGADYGLIGAGRCRVYILDECHKLSDSAQNLCLKLLEDTPETTVFILCSTQPQRIEPTLRSRCMAYELHELATDDITILVTRLLRKAKSDLPEDRLVDALVEQHIAIPRLICHAVDKYVSGSTPNEAADVEGMPVGEAHLLSRAIVKGDWIAVSEGLQRVQGSDIRGVRISIIAYLKAVLLESSDISTRTDVVAKAISNLCSLQNMEDLVMAAGVAAELYRVTAMFSKYKL